MHRIFPAAIALLFFSVSLAAQIEFQTDYTGTTQYQVPKGWNIVTNQDGNVYLWQAVADPNDPASPGVVVMALPYFQESKSALLDSTLVQFVQELSPEKTMVVSKQEVHAVFTGKIGQLDVQIAAMYLEDIQSNLIFLAFFMAPPEKYTELRKASFLYKVLNRIYPYDGLAATDLPPGQMNMQDPAVHQQILEENRPLSRKDLTGKWVQAVSLAGDQIYQDIQTGEIRNEERGYGHLIEFFDNGRYLLTYSYQNVIQNCLNAVEMVEMGTYTLKGTQLLLTQRQYKGAFNNCGQMIDDEKGELPDLTFRLCSDATRRHFVLQGQPFEYTISTEMDNAGKAFSGKASRVRNKLPFGFFVYFSTHKKNEPTCYEQLYF
jgi:hypothetical protein